MPYTIGEVEIVNEVTLAPSAVLYDGAVTADDDLSVKVNGFYYDFSGTHGKYLGSCGNAVTDNATSYVYLLSGGVLGISTSGYPGSAHIRLARVIAQSGTIVRIVLERAFFTTGSGGGPSTTAKAGVVVPGSFSGSPQTAVVAFSTAFPDTNYAITLSSTTDGSRSFAPIVESKTTTGFTINLMSSNLAGLVEVGWHAIANGS